LRCRNEPLGYGVDLATQLGRRGWDRQLIQELDVDAKSVVFHVLERPIDDPPGDTRIEDREQVEVVSRDDQHLVVHDMSTLIEGELRIVSNALHDDLWRFESVVVVARTQLPPEC